MTTQLVEPNLQTKMILRVVLLMLVPVCVVQPFSSEHICKNYICPSGYTCEDNICRPLCDGACCYNGKSYDVGEEFFEVPGCNTCVCTASGRLFCTDGPCRCLYEGRFYTAGDSFPADDDGCDTCSCLQDGNVTCTNHGCECDGTCCYNGNTYDVGDEFFEVPGCNTCVCTASGRLFCTDGPCRCLYEGRFYTAGDSLPADDDGCDTCNCLQDGHVICTNHGCECDSACCYNGEEYDLKDVFYDGCKRCVCKKNGTVICADLSCKCLYVGNVYSLGETVRADGECDICICYSDGSVRCEDSACTCTYNGTTYNNGDVFPAVDGCNTCTCADDGIVSCTEMDC